MNESLDVCVRGAGIVGRTLALLLAGQRLRVGLVQGPVPAGEDVRAYALNAASRRLLESVRCWPAHAATPVRRMRVFGDAGGEVNFASGPGAADAANAADASDAALAWIVDVPALERQLAMALQYAPQVRLLDAAQPAGLTVVCEGKASRTRADFGVEFDTQPYGQTAVAARLYCSQPHQHQAMQWFQGGEILGLLPLESSEGRNALALVWSVSEARAEALCAMAPEEFASALQAACRTDGNSEGGSEGGSEGDGQNPFGQLELASERMCWPLVQATARHWSGRTDGQAWVLAGDAAHAVHPLAGQGLNLGLADVAELAQVLGQRAGADYWRAVGDPRLLRQYERARRAALAPAGAVMDGLQRLFALDAPLVQRARNWGMLGFERSGPVKAWVARQAMGA